jgi:glycosyltransferase involved in cell wall biosynthesis
MKILFVINGLGTGGAERSLTEMLPAFIRAGLEPTVVCINRRDLGVQDPTRALGIDVQFLNGSGWIPRVRELRSLVRTIQPDLVHTTIFDADVLGRVAAAGTGAPVITSLVNTTYDPVRLQDPNIRRWRLGCVKAVDGLTARRLTTHFHAITNAVKDAAVRDLRIAPGDVTVIERGRDASRLGVPSRDRRERARRLLGLDSADVVLATVGRQEFQKGQWLLLEAMAALVTRQADLRLIIAGRRGNASRMLDDVMHNSILNGEVQFLGHRDDAPEILSAADVFVFPSLYEGLGGSLIEAMALGLPVIASDLPAIREVVEADRSALLVPPGSSGAIAAAVSTLVNDPDRRRVMGERGRTIFHERFTLERSTSRMVGLFQKVAARERHEPR